MLINMRGYNNIHMSTEGYYLDNNIHLSTEGYYLVFRSR